MRDARREISVLRGLVARLSRRLARVESHDRAACGLTDDQYGRFEEAFRGPFDDVAARLAVYLPLVENGASALGTRSVLDLGCGRGEWLQILDRAGYAALGVDERPNAVAACRALRIERLSSTRRSRSCTRRRRVTIVSAFHLVEHIATGACCRSSSI